MWIGEDAIPCTPGIAKVRSRTKGNNTRYVGKPFQKTINGLVKGKSTVLESFIIGEINALFELHCFFFCLSFF